MATFDFSKAAGIITSSPTPILDVLAVQYGVPNCMLEMARDVLAAIPSPILGSFMGSIDEGKALADSVFKDIPRKIFLDTGIVEYDTTTGRFVFVSASSRLGVEKSVLDDINNLFGLGTVLGFGAQAWIFGEKIAGQIEDIKNCIDKMKSFNALQKGPSALANKMVGFSEGGEPFTAPPPAEAASLVFDQNKDLLENAVGFINKANDQQNNIRSVIQARQKDPENNPEPVFWDNMVNTDPNSPWFNQTLGEALSGLTSFNLLEAETDSEGNPIVPVIAPVKSVLHSASGMAPPLSTKGKFLFSKTGIYYDSYGGGLEYTGCITNIVSALYYDAEGKPIPGAGVPSNMVKWMHEYNPNLGGKGEIVSWNTFNQWANTAFDITEVDESPLMQPYYDEDHFLQVLIDQRNRHIYDLSSYITDLQLSGYTEDSAVLSNQRELLYANIATHESKIIRRKKQIQVHVLLAPFGSPAPGNIPINNLENLDGSKIAIEKSKQEALMFHPGEMSGVVLPLCPTFIQSEVTQDAFTVNELMVPTVGVGAIISSDPYVSGTSGTVLSLDDRVTTDGLVSIYNFLDADLVVPDSEKYLVINCSTSSTMDKPAQLVASSIDSMFPSGIGIPYFRGVCNFFSGVDGDGNPKASSHSTNLEYLYAPFRPYGYGRIQSGWNDIESLLYNERGATFEFWTHVPDLGTSTGKGWNADNSLSALHRVALGCENRGSTYSNTNPYWIAGPQQGSQVVKGLLIGFSRDRRLTKGAPPSNLPADNDINDGLVFHMSPTQSINTSGVTFLAASANPVLCPENIPAPRGFYGIQVDTSTTTTDGSSFNDCSTNIMLATITVDHPSESVKIYLNGVLLATSSTTSVFGIQGPPRIPSMTTTSSFSYTNLQFSSLPPNLPPTLPPNTGVSQKDFWMWNGPEPQGMGGLSLTPWIIGGGYTDGMFWAPTPAGSNEGMNFMGGKWGGKKSGYYGYIGSLKLYNRAISASEILDNYQAQRGFFENIQL